MILIQVLSKNEDFFSFVIVVKFQGKIDYSFVDHWINQMIFLKNKFIMISGALHPWLLFINSNIMHVLLMIFANMYEFFPCLAINFENFSYFIQFTKYVESQFEK